MTAVGSPISPSETGNPRVSAYRACASGSLRLGAASRLVLKPGEAFWCGLSSHRWGGVVIRVLLADDQALVRAGFRVLLDSAAEIEVVGEASSGEQALTL